MKMLEINDDIFRAYDIRGIADRDLSDGACQKIGFAFGKYLVKYQYRQHLVLGYDGRLSSVRIFNALTQGLKAAGCVVTNIGLCPTPMLYFSVYNLKQAAGIMITGSHNPKDYNGMKIMLKDRPFFDKDILELREMVKDVAEIYDTNAESYHYNIESEYIDRILQDIDFRKIKSKIAWDCGNGATGNVVKKLLQKLPNDNILLYSDIDGNFPNHHPDPTEKKNLHDIIAVVKQEKCDFGIAFDGDGDRIGVVDDEGYMIDGDELLLFFARDILRQKRGVKIIMDVKSSQTVFDEINSLGGEAVMYRTGHSFIKQRMMEIGAELAGEMSGHVFFADKYYGFDDAIYAAIRFIQAGNGLKISDIRKSLPKKFSISERKVEVSETRKFVVIEEIVRRLDYKGVKYNGIDGVRVSNEFGWWLIRASNTQNSIIIRYESQSEDGLQKLQSQVDEQLKLSGLC